MDDRLDLEPGPHQRGSRGHARPGGQRRSAYARVLDKIAILQTWERHTASGMTERPDGTEFEPMTKIEREQLTHLIELRDMIRKKLIEHGQIEA